MRSSGRGARSTKYKRRNQKSSFPHERHGVKGITDFPSFIEKHNTSYVAEQWRRSREVGVDLYADAISKGDKFKQVKSSSKVRRTIDMNDRTKVRVRKRKHTKRSGMKGKISTERH